MDAIARFRPSARRRAANGTRSRRSSGSELTALSKQAAAAARMLKLVGNQRRLLILCFLAERSEMRAGELVEAVGLSQSALSQHLAALRAEGVVAFRRQSQMLHYRICDDRAARILNVLKEIYCGDMR